MVSDRAVWVGKELRLGFGGFRPLGAGSEVRL